MREIVFDTETTGLSAEDQVIEIGCVEMVDREVTGRTFHTFVRPTCRMNKEAQKIHGISEFFLRDKPGFVDISIAFLDFIGDAQLVAHNADFDVKMINREMDRIGRPHLANKVVDTLSMARKIRPNAKNRLDDLLRHFKIDASSRDKHGALIDSELLAQVYVELCGGRQTTLDVTVIKAEYDGGVVLPRAVPLPSRLTEDEIARHHGMIRELGTESVWLLYPECCPR